MSLAGERRPEDAPRYEGLFASAPVEREVLRQVIEQSPVGMVLVWGVSLRFVLANAAGLAMLPERGAIVDRTVASVYPELGEIAERPYRTVFETKRTLKVEAVSAARTGPGGPRPVFDAAYLPVLIDGEVGGVLTVYVDVTARARERQALQRDLLAERQIAETLQRSLLPDVLADIPRAEIATRYRAAGERFRAGGDFYDVFEAQPGRYAVVVGDVCGKGAEAAAATAMVRFALQAESMYQSSPALVLSSLNATLRRRGSGGQRARFCTVACACLAPDGDGLSGVLALGGHPPAIVVRADGVTERAGTAGDLLGVWPQSRHRDVELRLQAGDALILYTDGVLEAGAPEHTLEPEDLCQALAGRAQSAEELARRLEVLVAEQTDSPRDDLAIVVVRATG